MSADRHRHPRSCSHAHACAHRIVWTATCETVHLHHLHLPFKHCLRHNCSSKRGPFLITYATLSMYNSEMTYCAVLCSACSVGERENTALTLIANLLGDHARVNAADAWHALLLEPVPQARHSIPVTVVIAASGHVSSVQCPRPGVQSVHGLHNRHRRHSHHQDQPRNAAVTIAVAIIADNAANIATIAAAAAIIIAIKVEIAPHKTAFMPPPPPPSLICNVHEVNATDSQGRRANVVYSSVLKLTVRVPYS